MKSLFKIVAAGIVLVASCQAASEGSRIDLPEATLEGMSVEKALATRRSVRSYSADSLSLLEFSQILFAAQGITGARGRVGLRTAPSAGATYPMEIYAFANRVSGLEQGVYHYLPQDHALEFLKAGSYGDSLSDACLGQSMPREAAVSLVLAAVPERTTASYGTRGIRYIHMEAGHISQNICLEATSLGMGAVPIGAFDDAEVDRLIGADGEHEVSLYVNSIGKMEAKRGDHN
jgi:SagB-type dehydrogenase family enzyme